MEDTQGRKYDTVVFDLDGTLLDTLADLTDSVNSIRSSFPINVFTAAGRQQRWYTGAKRINSAGRCK